MKTRLYKLRITAFECYYEFEIIALIVYLVETVVEEERCSPEERAAEMLIGCPASGVPSWALVSRRTGTRSGTRVARLGQISAWAGNLAQSGNPVWNN